jgi:mannose-1-phosphate guanylyltransferase/mannose-6-phosphate isomerase
MNQAGYLSDKLTPVILCGGSGTRLWPLSRKSFPKQFVPLIGDKSLLTLTLERVGMLGPDLLCVAAEDHRFLITDAMDDAGLQGRVILEPHARNTAAAIALAAIEVGDDGLLLVCPADHHIPDTAVFRRVIEQGMPAAQAGSIVTFGVVPTFPSTAYGYIEAGNALGADKDVRAVLRFIEKPAADKATALLLAGNVLWNAGIFLARADVLLDALRKHAPDILDQCAAAMAACDTDKRDGHHFIRPQAALFSACRAESIDYAVLEHNDNIAVVPFAGIWSDVGSWNAVAGLTPADGDGNRVEGKGVVLGARNTFIHAPHRTVVALGTTNLLIIDTPDAVLIADQDHAEQVKHVVGMLESRQQPEAGMHRKVGRPWGWYDSIDAGERFQVKRIAVKPGASLSLQMHHHRAEHWIVVCGTAEVTRGEEIFLLTENQSTYIPVGEVHRLRNPGKTMLEMIEVQSGTYLGEDDIVRLEDHYGRAGNGKDNDKSGDKGNE